MPWRAWKGTRIQHMLAAVLLPPMLIMLMTLGTLHWRTARETARGIAFLRADVLQAMPRAMELERALASLNRALVDNVLSSSVRTREAQPSGALQAALWRKYEHYVRTLTLPHRPDVVRLLQDRTMLDDHHARETRALEEFARDATAMRQEMARVAAAVQRHDFQSARAGYSQDILPLVNSMQSKLHVLSQLQVERSAYAIQRLEAVHGRATRRLAAVAVVTTGLFTALVILLARRFAKPIVALTQAVEQFSDSAQVEPVALGAYGEIGQLARAFQHLRARLAASTQEAKAHAYLLEATARGLDEAQRVSGVGSWTYDLHTHHVTWSDQQYRLYGLEPGQFEPSYEAFVALVHPDDRARVVETVNRTVEEKSSFEYYYKAFVRGETRIFQARGRVGDGPTRAASLLSGTTQDVTDRKEAEAATRMNMERFELAARATHDSLWDWDIANDRVWWNRAFYEAFRHGAPTDDVPNRMTHIHPDDAPRVARSLEAFLASDREAWAGEYRLRRSDGVYVWVFDRGLVVRDASGAPQRMLGSMMNVTSRKEAERMTSDFVAFASHQLRTPLTGINWMLELALDVPGLPPAARRYLTDAEASSQRLVSLVNDLLDLSRLESSPLFTTPERLHLEPLTRAVAEELRPHAAEKEQEIVLQLESGTAPVMADTQLTRQVILNLLANAITYTPVGKRITVAVTRQDGAVRWSVTDSGIGVPKEAQARLFEKFFRAPNAVALMPEGTGLGLHLVQLIVQQSGGTVWCESDGEGLGATFSFEIPAAEAA